MRTLFSISDLKKASPKVGVLLVLAVSVGAAFLLTGCGDEDPVVIERIVIDNGPPSAPDGVFSITGDAQVEICWNPNPEDDIAGYDIYWNDEPTGYFEFVATVDANTTCYVDTEVSNAVTYFYAVLAFDKDGLESELSFEDVFDTPRPEGFDLTLFDYLGQDSDLSGYDFSSLSGSAQAWDDPTTDVYFGSPNGVPTLFADRGAGVYLQDYGYIDLLYVDWAPLEGWADSGRVELIEGHSYVVQIVDAIGHYNMAKFHVRAASPMSVTLDWAYQTDDDNPELAPGRGGAQK
ncbi:MAG: fibronectin type III domain-containing protein [Candidatus Krumholzibacteria bacterium]|nr:fibronectin type III domain-containing protein [Candidatus Krumholzibacteria bacterium]